MKKFVLLTCLFISIPCFGQHPETNITGTELLRLVQGHALADVVIVGNNWIMVQRHYRGFKEDLKVQIIQAETSEVTFLSPPELVDSQNVFSDFTAEIGGNLFRTPRCANYIIRLKGRVKYDRANEQKSLFLDEFISQTEAFNQCV